MGATYLVLSPIAPAEMLAIETELEQALERFYDEHPDNEDEIGDMKAGGFMPKPSDVEAAYRALGAALDPAILERFASCRSVFTIDRPGDIETTGGLQVSALRFVLERAGAGLVLLNDYPFVTSEQLTARLKKKRAAPGFAKTQARKPRREPKRREEKPGELRAVRVLTALKNAMRRPEAGIDARRALERAGELAQHYAALLVEEGALSDAQAARALHANEAEITAAADQLDRALRGLK